MENAKVYNERNSLEEQNTSLKQEIEFAKNQLKVLEEYMIDYKVIKDAVSQEADC